MNNRTAKRIADALERIADYYERLSPPPNTLYLDSYQLVKFEGCEAAADSITFLSNDDPPPQQ